MLKKSEIYKLVHDYIEVDYDGDMRDFSYQDCRKFYPYYCDLKINVEDHVYGTTRETFMGILEEASPLDQAKILRGVFKKYPLSYFNEKERETKQLIYDEYQGIIARLDFQCRVLAVR
jgi:hypothetical protein